MPHFHALEGSDTLDKVAKSVPGCKGISENATFRATSRRFATRSAVAKGLMLNELVGCERSLLVFFEAFTTEESVLQLGLQKMHNGTVHWWWCRPAKYTGRSSLNLSIIMKS